MAAAAGHRGGHLRHAALHQSSSRSRSSSALSSSHVSTSGARRRWSGQAVGADAVAALQSRGAAPTALRMSYKPEDPWEEAPSAAAQQPKYTQLIIGGLIVAAAAAAALLTAAAGDGMELSEHSSRLANFAASYNPVHLLQLAVSAIQDQGEWGYLYFGVLYVVAEILAIPALPLTASSGYLFGLGGGTAVVIVSASIAAGVSFLMGRTFLRSWVESLLGDNPKFKAVDAAIGREGFKIILLLRLSPIFPFAISNYLYGITSVDFWQYLSASIIGFLPGTIAYVYGGGQLGEIIGGDGSASVPWYAYAAGLAAAVASIKFIGDIATKAIEEIEPGIAGPDSQSDEHKY